MKYLSLTCLAAFGTFTGLAYAQVAPKAPLQTTHVIELFTSQGCSSCPPANRVVTQMADKPGVLALSYGVTYWDYLGWKDTFGDPKFTDRQRHYRQALDGANLYTPQIVLNGSAHSPRYSTADIRSMPLAQTSYQSNFTLSNQGLALRSDVPDESLVAIVTYKPGIQNVPVKRGENGGRTLEITNVVTDIQSIIWTRDVETIPAPNEGEAIAALFHGADNAKIISVATYTP